MLKAQQPRADSTPPVAHQNECNECSVLWSSLRQIARPEPDPEWSSITLVDLFCGTGGLTLGVRQAVLDASHRLDIRLALDSDPDVLAVYEANFPSANVMERTVEDHFSSDLGEPPSESETALATEIGALDLLVGGPPCQGHSDLNNHSRRDDERNGLYARMARAAEVLRPRAVLIENVPNVRNDLKDVVSTTIQALEATGYATWHDVLDLSSLGVPQGRKRHLILASRVGLFDPGAVMQSAIDAHSHQKPTTVRWAIEDLLGSNEEGLFDTASVPNDDNSKRIGWLVDNEMYDLPNSLRPPCHQTDHSYMSMYGRLGWDAPAQTLTTGYGSMGQGRYVHPTRRRTITPHEAARLQTFPDYFTFNDVRKRGLLAKMIGNAVPPAVAKAVCAQILPAITTHGQRE